RNVSQSASCSDLFNQRLRRTDRDFFLSVRLDPLGDGLGQDCPEIQLGQRAGVPVPHKAAGGEQHVGIAEVVHEQRRLGRYSGEEVHHAAAPIGFAVAVADELAAFLGGAQSLQGGQGEVGQHALQIATRVASDHVQIVLS